MAHDHEDLQVGWMNTARFFWAICMKRPVSLENRTVFFTSAGDLIYTNYGTSIATTRSMI